MTALYNQSKRAPCPLRFQVAAEGGWDIGGASGSLLAALLIGFGASLSAGILLSLLGVAGAFVLLRRYYAQHRDEAERPFSDLIADIGPIEREAEALVRRPRQSLS